MDPNLTLLTSAAPKEGMTDPRQMAAGIVGRVDWQTEVSGFCQCPGEALHTQPTGKADCANHHRRAAED